jgi:hypothetical protein
MNADNYIRWLFPLTLPLSPKLGERAGVRGHFLRNPENLRPKGISFTAFIQVPAYKMIQTFLYFCLGPVSQPFAGFADVRVGPLHISRLGGEIFYEGPFPHALFDGLNQL